jgi:hypothetical protein
VAPVRFFLHLLGWVLTPLVAWAAAYAGATIGALVGGASASSTRGFWITAGFGAVSALAAAWAWLRLLRRSRALREALAIAPDGTPLGAIEHGSGKAAP